MSTNINPKLASKGFFAKLFQRQLEKSLPRRFKRLIYVSSILGLIQEVKDPDMQMVKKLNDTFKLAEYPDAFAFPMYIKSVIWKEAMLDAVCIHSNELVNIDELTKHDLTTKDCTAIGEYFANNAPSWLRYGSLDLMVNDVVLLVKQLRHYAIESSNNKIAT